MRTKRFWFAIVGVPAAVIASASIALAVWSASGSGSGAGAATVAQNLVVTAVTPSGAGATLYPGGPPGPVYLSIQNPNPYGVTVTALAWGTPTSTNTAACASSNIGLDSNAPTAVSISIGAGATVSAVQVNNVLDLTHSAPNGCQGVAFDIPVTVTGTQQ